jgi:hypothetical protein
MSKYAVYPLRVIEVRKLLHFTFVLIPLVAGLDKFFNYLVDWNRYLSPEISSIIGIGAGTIMLWVGVIEIAVALLTAANPRVGGNVVALWLWLIIANFLTIPGFYDIALRDLGLSLGALALARLSSSHAEV